MPIQTTTNTIRIPIKRYGGHLSSKVLDEVTWLKNLPTNTIRIPIKRYGGHLSSKVLDEVTWLKNLPPPPTSLLTMFSTIFYRENFGTITPK